MAQAPRFLTAAIALLALMAAGAALYLLAPEPTAPATVTYAQRLAPEQAERDALSEAIAARLTLLAIGAEDVYPEEPIWLRSANQRWPVERMRVYLPPGLQGERAAHLIEAMTSAPEDTTWQISPLEDLGLGLEAHLGGVPTHLLQLYPAFPIKAPPRYSGQTQVALLVVGQGPTWEPWDRLLTLRPPLGVALQPFQPMTLHWAEEASIAGKEVYVHWPSESLGAGRAAQHLQAVPYAKGAYVPIQDPDQADGLLTLMHNEHLSVLSPGSALRGRADEAGLLQAHTWPMAPGHLHQDLRRLQALAARDGVAIGVIPAEARDVGSVLQWMLDAPNNGVEVVPPSAALE